MTLFGGYSYNGLNAAIGVQHTEVANLGVGIWVIHTGAKSGGIELVKVKEFF